MEYSSPGGRRQRPAPAPATGRKPQTGLTPKGKRRVGPVISGRLAYVVWLFERGELDGLVQQELALWRRRLEARRRRRGLSTTQVPSPLTASVVLRPVLHPALGLDTERLSQRFGNDDFQFDPEQPAIAVSAEFLGRSADLPSLGFIPVSQSGEICTGWVNLQRVKLLAEHGAMLSIDVLRVLAPSGIGGAPQDGGTIFVASTAARPSTQWTRCEHLLHRCWL